MRAKYQLVCNGPRGIFTVRCRNAAAAKRRMRWGMGTSKIVKAHKLS